ncbi:hypothetical protein ACIQRZ_02265 [Streptomyces rubiginosohelvolus]|uniref:hypothetical protein n=1 Tax=Streptomyces rubiginosohelvolus TaxID=67362 RepID=UPI0037FCCF36
MRVIPVDVSAATLLVTKLPEVKVRDRQTGEVAVDPTTNRRLMVLELVFIAQGGSDMIKVTVPEPGIGEGLVMGGRRQVRTGCGSTTAASRHSASYF